MAKQKITIDDLARMINEGFKATASKEDLTALEGRLTTRLDNLDARVDHFDARMGRIEADLHGPKLATTSL
jgi:hypothetical protein